MSLAALPKVGDLHVARTRWHSARHDAQGIRREAESVLSALPSQPAGLPALGLLVVRRLGLRRVSRHDGSAFDIDGAASALREALERSAELAARPVHGPVTHDCAAVRFDDWCDLLACLAMDLIQGRAASRWWWRALAGPTASPLELMRGLSLRQARSIPAMLRILWVRHAAAQWIQCLGAAHLHPLYRAVADAHDVAHLPPEVLGLDAASPRATAAPSTPAASRALAEPGATARRTARPSGPIRESGGVVHEALECLDQRLPIAGLSMLDPAGRALWRLALGLTQAPAELRGVAAAVAVPTPHQGGTPGDVGMHASSTTRREPASVWVESGAQSAAQPAVLTPADPARISLRHCDGAAISANPGELAPQQGRGGDRAARSPRAAGRVEETHRPIPSALAPRPVLPGHESAVPPAAWHLADARLWRDPPGRPADAIASEVVQTRLGGAFYLVNMALELGLYRDFTRPREPGITWPIWDFLAFACSKGLGNDHASDPLWSRLAGWAGRLPGDRAEESFDAPTEWRLPPAGLAPFTNRRGAWRWADGHERLRVTHPSGFTVIDVALGSASLDDVLDVELHRYRAAQRLHLLPTRVRCGAVREAWPSAWFDHLFAWLEARCRLVRGGPRALAGLVARPARLDATPTRLDIHFSLDEHPIEIRLAGLDRDPGWIPAAGRTIAFHYD